MWVRTPLCEVFIYSFIIMYEENYREEEDTFNKRLIRAIEKAFLPSSEESLESKVQEESREEHQALIRSNWLNDIHSVTHA